MKRHWRLGILLGVSVALLLAGGVALAQGLFVTVDQECFECWEPVPNGAVPDEYVPHLTFADWRQDGIDEVCEGVHSPGADPVFDYDECWPPDAPPDPCWIEFVVYCDGDWGGYDACIEYAPIEQLAVAEDLQEAYGQWVGWIEEYDGGEVVGRAEVTFRFAEVCEAEFVPEPATIALLGSGLAGLAGYAALRWRSRS